MEALYWLILLAILLVIEFITLGLTTIWFAGGALAAFIVSLVSDSLLLQLIFFLIISFLFLFLTRPIAVRYFNNKREKTNYEGLIGKEGKVIQRIDNFNNSGEVNLNGQIWMARAADEGATYEENTHVIVKEIAGVKLMVGSKVDSKVEEV